MVAKNFILFALGSFFLFSSSVFAQFDTTFSEKGTQLISAAVTNLATRLGSMSINVADKQKIVGAFCEALDPLVSTGFSSPLERYESQQSLFLYLLCNTNGLKTPYFNQNVKDTVKTLSYKTLKFETACRSEYLEKCNLATLTEQIITQLFAELFTMKQAEIFGLSQATLEDERLLNKKINAYAEEKFQIKKFCDDKTHRYEKTCNHMKRQMKAFISAIDANQLINAELLYTQVKEKEPISDFLPCQHDGEYQLLLCGILGETDDGLKPFISLIYNELAWYTMFTTYYAQMLSQRNEIDFALQDEIEQLWLNQQKMFAVSNTSLKELVQLARTYPIHI